LLKYCPRAKRKQVKKGLIFAKSPPLALSGEGIANDLDWRIFPQKKPAKPNRFLYGALFGIDA